MGEAGFFKSTEGKYAISDFSAQIKILEGPYSVGEQYVKYVELFWRENSAFPRECFWCLQSLHKKKSEKYELVPLRFHHIWWTLRDYFKRPWERSHGTLSLHSLLLCPHFHDVLLLLSSKSMLQSLLTFENNWKTVWAHSKIAYG